MREFTIVLNKIFVLHRLHCIGRMPMNLAAYVVLPTNTEKMSISLDEEG